MRLPTTILWLPLAASFVAPLYGQDPLPGSRPIRIDTTLINDLPPEKQDETPPPEKGQVDPPDSTATALPENLADALTRALRSNPDVQLAVAHLDEIQAQRDQTRLKVVELVTRAVHEHQLASAGRQVGRDDPRAPRVEDVWARLAYLLGAGNDESPEQLAKQKSVRTNAEMLANNLAQNLGKAIERALIANPDVRLADAKVRVARAELNQVKLATAQKVTVAYGRWESARSSFSRSSALGSGSVPSKQIRAIQRDVAEAAADLAYLLGNGAEPSAKDAETVRHPAPLPLDSGGQRSVASAATRPGVPEQYAELMKKPVRVRFNNFKITDVLALWNDQTGGELRIVANPGKALYDLDIPGEVPLATALEMLADLTDSAFVFRDYGLLAVPREDAWKYTGAAIPADAPLTAGNH